jgi:hypothetical protein
MASLAEHSGTAFAFLAQSRSPQVRALAAYSRREADKVIQEARALANILDGWLWTEHMPSAEEFNSYARRVLRLEATWTPVAKELAAAINHPHPPNCENPDRRCQRRPGE